MVNLKNCQQAVLKKTQPLARHAGLDPASHSDTRLNDIKFNTNISKNSGC
jgi:hypothetical protein